MAAWHYAEQHCWKFKSSKVPWCLNMTRVINTILYWKGILQQQRGGRVGSLVLHWWVKKGGFQHDLQNIEHSEVEIFTHIKKAYQRFDWLESDQLHCDTWLAQMIEVQAAAKNLPNKAVWKQIRTIERIRLTAAQVKQASVQPLRVAVWLWWMHPRRIWRTKWNTSIKVCWRQHA